MNCLYILAAPSTVGKSTLLQRFILEKTNSKLSWCGVNKYSTRDCRGTDSEGITDDVIDIDNRTDELRSARTNYEKYKKLIGSNDQEELQKKIAYEDLIKERFQYIKNYCGDQSKGVAYHMNANIYGFNYQEIADCLKNNNAALICSNFDAILELKNNKQFGNRVQVIYIASSMDERIFLSRFKIRMEGSESIFNLTPAELEEFEEHHRLMHFEKSEEKDFQMKDLWSEYNSTIQKRKEEIRILFEHYINNIGIVDHVILNFYDLEYMYKQMREVIKKNNECKTLIRKSNVPIFMVCAAPSSGKGTLMEIVGDTRKVGDSILRVKKYTKCERSPWTNRRDNIEPIGNDGTFENYIPANAMWAWKGHRTHGHCACVERECAVNLEEMQKNMMSKKAQIFIADFQEIEYARELFPENIVILYLHATHNSATMKHITRKRTKEIREEIAKDAKEKEKLILNDNEIYKRVITEPCKTALEKKIQADLKEIRAIHEQYAEFIGHVDHVLLNTGTQNDLALQMRKLLKEYGCI